MWPFIGGMLLGILLVFVVAIGIVLLLEWIDGVMKDAE